MNAAHDPATVEFLADRTLSRSARRTLNRLVDKLGARVVNGTEGYVCPRGGHAWYWLQSASAIEDCEQPSIFVCENCAMAITTRCGAASMRRCAPCARRHKRRVRKVFASGLVHDDGERVWWLTLTAPGDDEHWNPNTGEMCDCTPAGGVDPAEFNTRLPRAWSDLITYVRRELGPLEYGKSMEVQGRRSVRTGRAFLHIHALVRSAVDLGAHLERLRELVIDLGFGHSLKLVQAEARHAAYAAKYASGSVDERHQVEWLVDGETVRGAPRMRTWTCSRKWGSTMKAIKQAEIAWATTGSDTGEDGGTGASRARQPPRPTPARVQEVIALLESLSESSTVHSGTSAQLALPFG